MAVVVLAPEAQVERPADGGVDAFPMLFLPSSLTFLPIMYAVCARGGRREAVASIVMAAAGVALASAGASDQVVPPGYPPAVQYRIYLAMALLSSVSAAWVLGMSRAAQTARETARRAEATRAAVLADRARIARDMHDVVAHSLAVIVRQAEGGALLAERAPGRAEQVLRTIAQVGREALTDMRGMLTVMRDPDRACGDGTSIAAWSSLADLPALMDRVRSAGLDVDLTEHGTRHGLGPAGELAAYHVLQEALTYTVKHAGPGARVGVTLNWQPETMAVEVRDGGPAGSAPGPHPPVPGTGSGLLGLRERVEAVGGTLDAGSQEAGPGRAPTADGTGTGSPPRDRHRPCEPRDRRPAARDRGDRQDARRPHHGQARAARPDPHRDLRLRPRPGPASIEQESAVDGSGIRRICGVADSERAGNVI